MHLIARQFSQGLLALVCLSMATSNVWGAVTPEQKQQIDRAKLAVRAAERLLQAGRSKEALEFVAKAQVDIAALKADKLDPDAQKLATPLYQQLDGVYVLLELNGLAPPAMPEPKAKEEMAKPGEPSLGPRPGAPANGMVSFAKEVAPLLIAKCGGCHVNQAKGKVSMATYAALMQGSPDDGVIILPGKGTGSRIYEVIESGDMPRGGGKLSAGELALLTKWIDQGAKNDGPSDETPLKQLASATAAAMPAPLVVAATGKEKVSFGLHVAPILLANCNGCHGADRPRGDLSFDTLARMFQGGESGPPVVPGKPAESLLVKKIKGLAGERMPQGKPALSADAIAQIETWIQEGAKLDGETPTTPIRRIADVVRARNSTPEQLTAMRSELAAVDWRLALPDAAAARAETDNFLVLGNVGQATLEEVAALAEAQVDKLGAVLPGADSAVVNKGRVTLFVFANRYDYTEFGTMVERRELPRSWAGHWRFDEVKPYLAIHYARDRAEVLDALLAQQILSLNLASRGQATPRWFAEGVGRALAAKMYAKSPLIEAWNAQLPAAVSQMTKPDDFLAGKLAPEDADVVSYSFGKFLLTSNSRFNALLKTLGPTAPFDAALQSAYGGPAMQLAAAWGKWAQSKIRR